MKEVAMFDGDISKFAPPQITEAVRAKMYQLRNREK